MLEIDQETLKQIRQVVGYVVETEEGCYCGRDAEHFVGDEEQDEPCIFCIASALGAKLGSE